MENEKNYEARVRETVVAELKFPRVRPIHKIWGMNMVIVTDDLDGSAILMTIIIVQHL